MFLMFSTLLDCDAPETPLEESIHYTIKPMIYQEVYALVIVTVILLGIM
jgi:hypothetical protein